MSAPAPAVAVSAREQCLIAGAFALGVIPVRAVSTLYLVRTGSPLIVHLAVSGLVAMVMLTLLIPPLIALVQRISEHPVRALAGHLSLAAVVAVLSNVLTIGLFYLFMGVAADLRTVSPIVLFVNALVGVLLYAMTAGITRAIQWYRSSVAIESEQAEIEAGEIRGARELIEETLRPRTVTDVLGRVEKALVDDPAYAEKMVRALARHGRRVLNLLDAPVAMLEVRLRALRSALIASGVPTVLRSGIGQLRPRMPDIGRFLDAVEQAIAGRAIAHAVIESWEEREAIGLRVHLEGRDAEAVLGRIAIEGGGASMPGAVELVVPPERPADAPRPAPIPVRIGGSIYPWLAGYLCLGTLGLIGLGAMDADPLGTSAEILSAFLWLALAPLLMVMSARATVLPRFVAASCIVLAAAGSALLVTWAAFELSVSLHAGFVLGMPVDSQTSALIFTRIFTRNSVIAFGVVAVNFAFSMGRRLLKLQEATARMRTETASAELRELEARIHPHFLFNALASLIALIGKDVDRSVSMCVGLSRLFSSLLSSTGVQTWTLASEIDLVAEYAGIQQIRFAERMSVSFDIEPALGTALVPRLLLQPLVENAVKHGVAHREEATAIHILVTRRARALELTVRNDADCDNSPVRFGRGLTFVAARTRAAGGEMQIESAPEQFLVRCLLPL